MCPKVNARKNVLSVEGAALQPPTSRRVGPARSSSQPSMREITRFDVDRDRDRSPTVLVTMDHPMPS